MMIYSTRRVGAIFLLFVCAALAIHIQPYAQSPYSQCSPRGSELDLVLSRQDSSNVYDEAAAWERIFLHHTKKEFRQALIELDTVSRHADIEHVLPVPYNRAILYINLYVGGEHRVSHLRSARAFLLIAQQTEPLFLPTLVMLARVNYLEGKYYESYNMLTSVAQWIAESSQQIGDVWCSNDIAEVIFPADVVFNVALNLRQMGAAVEAAKRIEELHEMMTLIEKEALRPDTSAFIRQKQKDYREHQHVQLADLYGLSFTSLLPINGWMRPCQARLLPINEYVATLPSSSSPHKRTSSGFTSLVELFLLDKYKQRRLEKQHHSILEAATRRQESTSMGGSRKKLKRWWKQLFESHE